MATATFSIGLLADITLSRTLFRIKNVLAITSAPMEVLVSILYWGLRAVRLSSSSVKLRDTQLREPKHQIDPRLVLPEHLPQLPIPADCSFHLVPAVVLALDLLFFSPPWTITFVPATVLSTVIAFGYWFWIELCYSYNGFYPYPIFEQLDRNGRIALFGMSAAVFTVSTFGLKRVQRYVHGGERAGKVKG